MTCTTPQFGDVIGILDDMASNSVDSSDITTSMEDLKTSLASMPDLGAQVTEIESLESSLSGVPDVNSFSSQFDSFGTVLNDAPDISSMTGSFDSLDSALGSLPDLGAQQDMMVSINTTVSEVPYDQFDMVISLGNSLIDLLYNDLNTHLNKLNKNQLDLLSLNVSVTMKKVFLLIL